MPPPIHWSNPPTTPSEDYRRLASRPQLPTTTSLNRILSLIQCPHYWSKPPTPLPGICRRQTRRPQPPTTPPLVLALIQCPHEPTDLIPEQLQSHLYQEVADVRLVALKLLHDFTQIPIYDRRLKPKDTWTRCVHITGGKVVFASCSVACHVGVGMCVWRER